MSADSGDRKIELEELKARRKLLFKQFVEHPSDVRVSLQIKRIDDQIAEFNDQNEPQKMTREDSSWALTVLRRCLGIM